MKNNKSSRIFFNIEDKFVIFFDFFLKLKKLENSFHFHNEFTLTFSIIVSYIILTFIIYKIPGLKRQILQTVQV